VLLRSKQSGGKEGQREGKDTTARLGAGLVQRRPTRVSWTLSRRGPADWSGLSMSVVCSQTRSVAGSARIGLLAGTQKQRKPSQLYQKQFLFFRVRAVPQLSNSAASQLFISPLARL